MKNPKLTEQENQDVLYEQSLAAIDDLTLRKSIIEFGEKIKHSETFKEAQEFKKEIFKSSPRPEQQVLSFIPHTLAKVSIFFPMSDRELKEEGRRINKLERETSWGKFVVEGIKLAIFEEDILLAILKIARKNIKYIDGKYKLETNMHPIINLLYGESGYTKKSYERIESTLQHFQLVRFELTTFDWKKKGNERLKSEVVRSIGNIIQSYKYDKKTKHLVIYFNPFFVEYFYESMLTEINLTLRRNLKKDGSKALLRFLSTHTKPSRMHILTVLNAINFNINQPTFKLRQLLKSFIKELKKFGVLGKKTKIYKDDTVYFDVLSPKKMLFDYSEDDSPE